MKTRIPIHMFRNLATVWMLAALPLCLAAEEVTGVKITDQVEVADLFRFGINDRSGGEMTIQKNGGTGELAINRIPIVETFEAGWHRFFVTPGEMKGRVVPCVSAEAPEKGKIKYWVVAGPSKWTEGVVVEGRKHDGPMKKNGKGQELLFDYVLDKDIELKKDSAILLEQENDPSDLVEKQRGWKEGRIEETPAAPGSVGKTSLLLDGSQKPSGISFSPTMEENPFAPSSGEWKARIWAKAKTGNPTVTLDMGRFGKSVTVKLETAWKRLEGAAVLPPYVPMTITMENYQKISRKGYQMKVEISGGEAYIDDLEVWCASDKNPTVYRDHIYEYFTKKLRPGILRWQQGSGKTMLPCIMPALKSRQSNTGNMHDFFQSCEAVDAVPYYCTPGSITREEMKGLMEYIGAPATVGWGKIRAELGHPKPWTETLREIIIEIGNETYNFGGFGGPDYWHDLVETGKQDPYYSKKVFFTMGWQGRALDFAQNTDGYSITGYTLNGISKVTAPTFLTQDTDALRWAMGWAQDDVHNRKAGPNFKRANPLGIELCMYEGNYHFNFGDGPNIYRNKITASAAGGINYLNRMLIQLRQYKMRRQCFFMLSGREFFMPFEGAFGSPQAGHIKMFGDVVSLFPGRERYRPISYAMQICNNHVLSGNLIETVHSGANPTFSATGTWLKPHHGDASGYAKDKIETKTGFQTLFSYATADGKKRALMLINLDVEKEHKMKLEFPWKVAGGKATQIQLKGKKSFTDMNEVEYPEEMAVPVTTSVEKFASGYEVVLPLASMTVFTWEIQ